MIGVVVWSNSSREQAVIWCDDHAALAYLSSRENFVPHAPWPQPGDLVQLSATVVGDLRCARTVSPLSDGSVCASSVGRVAPQVPATSAPWAEANVVRLRRAAG